MDIAFSYGIRNSLGVCAVTYPCRYDIPSYKRSWIMYIRSAQPHGHIKLLPWVGPKEGLLGLLCPGLGLNRLPTNIRKIRWTAHLCIQYQVRDAHVATNELSWWVAMRRDRIRKPTATSVHAWAAPIHASRCKCISFSFGCFIILQFTRLNENPSLSVKFLSAA